ncbi:MAG: glycosyl hydrolase family 18 protein [Patescibacteria group bacterium]|jgi:spore germination protein YaaH
MHTLFKGLLSGFLPLLLGVMLGFGVIFFYSNFLQKKTDFLSPLGTASETPLPRVSSKKPVIGFLPYWNIRKSNIPYHLLDFIAYFSLDLDKDGSIKKMDKHNVNLGWYQLQSERLSNILETAKKNEVKTMLVVTAFDNEIIDSLTTNPDVKVKTVQNIVQIVDKYNFDAVNLDFEYDMTNQVKEGNSQAYAQFIDQLRRELQIINPNINISVDLYANAFIKNFPYQVEVLEEAADYLILMGYDFHQASSANAGPVAPLRSNSGKSITHALEAAIQKDITLEKIILAVPFYGYEWQTVNTDYAAQTYPNTGVMASYNRVHALISQKNLEPQWDFQAMSPWLVYEADNEIKQIYFENDESIALKLQLVNQTQLGGVAIWALGYEGENATVWSVIEKWRRAEPK